MISILSYGIGNPSAIANMLDYIGYESELISNPEKLESCEKLILPGVGHFDACVSALQNLNLFEPIKNLAQKGNPILGICLGAQLLGQSSEEGSQLGLGLLPMNSIKFPDTISRAIPRMEWGEISISPKSNCFVTLTEDSSKRFYFSHSYFLNPLEDQISVGTTEYDIEYTCVVEFENIVGVQFHPEKSHKFGMKLLECFADWKL